jgi:hypothetical protein
MGQAVSDRNVHAEHLLQVAAIRHIIVHNEHFLIEVQCTLGDTVGPFRPNRGISTRTDADLYPAGPLGRCGPQLLLSRSLRELQRRLAFPSLD